MKKIFACGWLAFMASAAGAQALDTTGFRASAPVQRASAEGLQRLSLPLPVLQASRSVGYADVRLSDATGHALPTAWAAPPLAAAPAERAVVVPRFAWPADAKLGATTDGATPSARIRVDARGAVIDIAGTVTPRAAVDKGAAQRWLLDVSALASAPEDQKGRLTALTLDWPARAEGLSMQAQVEASDDAKVWRLVTTAPLLDLPGAVQASANLKQIAWPQGEPLPRYLRLAFDAPLALSRSEVRLTKTAPPADDPSAAFEFTREAQDAQAPPAWTLDLQGRVTLTRIDVQLAEPNTVSAVRLEHRDEAQQPWQAAASFVAWRLLRHGQEQRSAPIALPGATAARYWRLVADGRTAPPGGASVKAQLSWHPAQLVFAGGTGEITLWVGQDRAAPAQVPLPTLMPDYKAGDEHRLPAATVGALTARTLREPSLWEQLSAPNAQQRKQWLLWAVLAVAVLGLGVLALRLARDVNRKPQ